MRRIAFAPLLGLSLFATASAPAHDLVPASWCYGGTRQVLLDVTFYNRDLLNYKNTHPLVDLATGQPSPNNTKCGIVDDDWHWATQMMLEGLPAGAGQRTATSTGVTAAAGQVIAVVVTEDYNAPDHHTRYSFVDGLRVQYLECRFPQNTAK
jgi:hypothetical protein